MAGTWLISSRGRDLRWGGEWSVVLMLRGYNFDLLTTCRSSVPSLARFSMMVLMAIGLQSCGGGSQRSALPSGGGYYKVGTPYTINGQRFVPREDPRYDRTGYASWYGDKFNGRQTANGEVFNMNALSAAHTTLPMPIHVRVTNLENNKSLILRVNDRGPFVKDRIIDVSKQAAKELGFYNQGTAKVRVQYVGRAPLESYYAAKPKTTRKERLATVAAPVIEVSRASVLAPPEGASAAPQVATGSTPAPSPSVASAAAAIGQTPAILPQRKPGMPPSLQTASLTSSSESISVSVGQRFIRVGAYLDAALAGQTSSTLQSLGTAQVRPETVDGQTYYLVLVGPLSSDEEADTQLGRLLKMGHSDARMVIK